MSRYKINGVPLPSVTQIIGDCTDKSGALTQWGANQACEYIRQNAYIIDTEDSKYIIDESILNDARFNYRTVSQEALDVGSEVHNAIEKYLKGVSSDQLISSLRGEAANGFGAFLSWSEDVGLSPIAIEETVFTCHWAGTLDYRGYYKGKLYVMDWKSSKAIYPEYRYQVAAYRSCIPEAEGNAILRLDKTTGEPQFKDVSKTYRKDLAVFNAMVDLFYLRHPKIRKQVFKEAV